MCREQIVEATRTDTSSEISIATRTHRETSKTNCPLFVDKIDKNFVSLEIVASAESTTTAKTSSATCQQTKAQQHSCIYKRSEMARRISCLRYLLAGSFIILGISGAVVCGTGSYFVHQLHGSLTNAELYGPPVLLLTTGIVNIFLGLYFWFSFDIKYNAAQIFMFFIFVILVAIIEAGAGIWAIVDHGSVDSSIAKILENNLASVGTIDNRPTWNITEIKVNCCGFEKSSLLDDDDDIVDNRNKISWSCCNTKRHNNVNNRVEDTCAVFYINECRDLALHRYRSVLIYTFIIALCATILQILEAVFLHAYAKRMMKKKRRQSSMVVAIENKPHPQITGPVVQLGPQHVCEGCSNVHYHGR